MTNLEFKPPDAELSDYDRGRVDAIKSAVMMLAALAYDMGRGANGRLPTEIGYVLAASTISSALGLSRDEHSQYLPVIDEYPEVVAGLEAAQRGFEKMGIKFETGYASERKPR